MEKIDIKDWLQNQIAQELGTTIEEVSCDEDFENLKLDSLALVSLSYELESQANIEISPTIFTEFNTINKLAAWINAQK
ncbi:acyl carrier protein [Chryseosolibacter indicus]|uniref:Acyl carrier protein n=1 Tax=Chryseosolibacter indicus TaxID=2782351 RepID=A0ABS5VVC0_9BACT|nr:acyl carrier protein [Chryseosolibacter indicus]MBT1705388.1 acyl carrier protein [Chryseosolibacter indicus]